MRVYYMLELEKDMFRDVYDDKFSNQIYKRN